jgi:glutamate N-acetyltransferase/amino-acid N-acetyltransferase
VQLPIEKMEASIARLPGRLRSDGSRKAARAIMTSDSFPKEIAVELEIGGKKVRIGGIAKGAGMIDPNMATMLSFITTDAVIGKGDLQKALRASVGQSFNRITVDGDMSTNDTVLALANGRAENRALAWGGAEFAIFQAGLDRVTAGLARMIVKDGEGVSRFIDLHVTGARTDREARLAARAVANSILVKCSWYGGDPNWGRIMDAVGYSGARIREERIRIAYNGVAAVEGGMPAATPGARLRAVARKKEFAITVDLGAGNGSHRIWTTDLTTKYVEFNMGE